MEVELALARAAMESADANEEAAKALVGILAQTETGHGAVNAVGEFMRCVWARVVRYGYDKSQRTEEERRTMYVFNGATYEAIVGREKRAALESRMKAHVIACLERLCASAFVRERYALSGAVLAMCRKPRRMASALKVAFDGIRGLRRRELSVCPRELAYTLDTGDFIGLTNGVFDPKNDVFFPIGSVPNGVRVSMCAVGGLRPPRPHEGRVGGVWVLLGCPHSFFLFFFFERERAGYSIKLDKRRLLRCGGGGVSLWGALPPTAYGGYRRHRALARPPPRKAEKAAFF
jgi:hypothetical protein